jgi:hypothetical protein
MKIALYIGDHKKDTLIGRIGWALIRYTQTGKYRHVTHVEAIHEEYPDGTVSIASASLRDGGVRRKRVKLDSKNWLIVSVRRWDVEKSISHYRFTQGYAYDWRGALATKLPALGQFKNAYFCNEHVGAPFLRDSETFAPQQFAAICMSIGEDVTAEFFAQEGRA